MMLTPRTYPTQTFIWLSRNLSRACHANILQRNDSKDFWAKKKKHKKTGGTPAYLPRLCHIRVKFCINKRLISEWQSLE